MTKDPVCECNVDEIEAMSKGLSSEYHGQTQFFCSRECLESFEDKPSRYIMRFGIPEDKLGDIHGPALF